MMTKLLAVASVLILLGSCGLAKAIDYSFYVPEHVEFELEGITEEEFNEANEERSKIHVGGDQYRHLEGYDMNDLCSRVVVYGEK